MTTYYIDPENGNDSNNGQSFANRTKKTVANYQDGDQIRFIRSPAPTSLGNGSWAKDSTYNHNELIDSSRRIASGGTVTINGQSAGNPTTVARSNHGLSTGDAVFFNTVNPSSSYAYAGPHLITKVDDDNFTLDGTENAPDTDSVNGVYAYDLNPFCVRLASSPIKNIICYQGLDGGGDKNWTIAQGIGARNTAYMQSGYDSARTFKPGNDAIGKVAHVQLDNALDLSGYQQISLKYFWTYASGGQDPDADIFSLRLCSDTGGDTTVHTVPIKPPPGDDQDQWGWYTHDFGTNLNSSIQSIALHLDKESEHANLQIEIDNVIACKAKSADDSLHLGSLIGKGNTFMSTWYPIMAIVGNIVLIESNPYQDEGLNDSTSSRPLIETTETVTTYKQECFTRPDHFNGSEETSWLFVHTNYETGITISGGWNSTDMATQDTNAGSWLAAQSGMYTPITALGVGDLTMNNLGFVRGFTATHMTSPETGVANISNCQVINSKYGMLGPSRSTYDNCKFYGTYFGRVNGAYTERHSVIKNCTFTNSSFYNASNISELTIVDSTIQVSHHRTSPLIPVGSLGGLIFSNCTIDKQYALVHGEDYSGFNSFVNCAITDLEVGVTEGNDPDDGDKDDRRPYVSLINYNNAANDHRLYYMNCFITSDSSVTQSGSGFSWKYTQQSVTADQTREVYDPMRFKLAEVYVTANSQVTATIYARRTHTASDDYVALAVLAHDNAPIGIATDVKSSALSAAANTWQQLTLNFTPTKEGVATITALMACDQTANNVWIDTLEIA